MIEEVAVSGKVTCPACHFRCQLVKYQCGRGKEFYDLAAAGEEIPERRGPMPTPSERATCPDGKPPVNDRVIHAANILSNRLNDLKLETGDRKVVLALGRAGSFMTLPILAHRMMLSADELDPYLEEAQQNGFVALETDERGYRIACLTDSGLEQAAVWKAERDEENSAFLSELSEEEKEELVVLIRKLLGMRH